MLKLATLAASIALLVGCAGTDSKTASNRPDLRDAEVRTGTRLPPRDPNGVKVISGQDYKQDANRTIGDAPRGK